jgi:hypothetical protein
MRNAFVLTSAFRISPARVIAQTRRLHSALAKARRHRVRRQRDEVFDTLVERGDATTSDCLRNRARESFDLPSPSVAR